MTAQRHYEIHGIHLRLSAASDAWVDAVHEILSSYECSGASELALSAYLGGEERSLAVPKTLTERGRFGDLVFLREESSGQTWIQVHQQGWVRVNTQAGSLHASLDYDPREDNWFVAHHAFYPGFLELLKSRGLFPAHSGLVSRGEDGMLICGASGSGKTTLCLELATHGWEFLADDTCFLRKANATVEGLAFLEDLHVTEETMKRFDSLAFLRAQPQTRENWKRHFAVQELPELRPRERCYPRWIVFPRVHRGQPSELRQISSGEALLRLMPQSVIPVDMELATQHLEVLGDLANQVDAYELAMGENLEEVRECLESGMAGRVA